MPDDNDIYDDEMTEWIGTVELRFKQLNLKVMVTGGVAAAGVGLAFFAFKGLSNLARSMGEIGQATNALMQVTFGQPVAGTVNDKVVAPNGSIDETPMADGPIAKPADGPVSEASDKVKGLIASDPISPAELARLDQERMRGEGA